MKRLFAALVLSVMSAWTFVPALALAQTSSGLSGSAVMPPTCQIVADGYSQGVGDTVNLSWTSTDASGGTITTIGSVGTRGTQGVIPQPPATTYVGTFTGPGGSVTCSVTVPVNSVGGYGSGGSYGGGTGGFGSASVTPPPSTPTGGLVTCNSWANCDICHLSSTLQNVINLLIGLSIPIAAGMFAFAGWLYFSSREDTAQIQRAHRIFSSVLIGFCIALMAWLFVQTMLKVLAPGYVNWDRFDCTGQRLVQENLKQVLTDTLGTPQQAPLTAVPNAYYGCQVGTLGPDGNCYNNGQVVGQQTLIQNTSSGAYTCADNYSGNLRVVNGQCVDEFDNVVGPATQVQYGTSGKQCAASNTSCSIDVLQNMGFEPQEANAMSCIAVTESSGNPYTPNSVTGACGLFQITRGNWNNPKYHQGSCSTSSSCNDPYCNAQAAQLMFNEQGYQPWTGICDNPTGCGVVGYGQPWNANARGCVQRYDSQAYNDQVAV
jgi:hypothetical protein